MEHEFSHAELTHTIIGMAMEVHRVLKPGLDEIGCWSFAELQEGQSRMETRHPSFGMERLMYRSECDFKQFNRTEEMHL